MLELHEWKHSRAVLRGGGGGDVTSLPDQSVRGSSQRRRVCGRPEPAGPDIMGRGARRSRKGRTTFPGGQKVGGPSRSQRAYLGRIGVKHPEMGSKRRSFRSLATWVITAQLLFENTVKSRVASHEPHERNRPKSQLHINLIRKRSSPNFRP